MIDFVNIDIDEKRGNFIIKKTPESFSEEKQKISTAIGEEKFTIEPFEDYEGSMILCRKPNRLELK